MGSQGRNFGRSLKNYFRHFKMDMVSLQDIRCRGFEDNNTIIILDFCKNFRNNDHGFVGAFG